MVSTDFFGRSIDVSWVNIVINYDIETDTEKIGNESNYD